jgi:hypothetical protein
MPDEKPAPLPLTGEEVQEAILYKVATSLLKTCHLKSDNAYTSFKAEITIRLTLSDFGREVKDNHIVKEEGSIFHPPEIEAELVGKESYPDLNKPRQVDANIVMEPMPPNQVRIETDQAVPVPTVEGGKKVIRHLKYAARKPKQ